MLEGKNGSDGGLTREPRKRVRREKREMERREQGAREGAEGGDFTITVASNREKGPTTASKGNRYVPRSFKNVPLALSTDSYISAAPETQPGPLCRVLQGTFQWEKLNLSPYQRLGGQSWAWR